MPFLSTNYFVLQLGVLWSSPKECLNISFNIFYPSMCAHLEMFDLVADKISRFPIPTAFRINGAFSRLHPIVGSASFVSTFLALSSDFALFASECNIKTKRNIEMLLWQFNPVDASKLLFNLFLLTSFVADRLVCQLAIVRR